MTDTSQWYGPDIATFGDRLAAAREAAGMTQDDLAKRLGIKLKSLQSWENDTAEPRANKLSMLSGLLNVSMGWLITGEGEGLSAPEEAEETSPDIQSILLEIRGIRAHLQTSSDKLSRLEKRLRGIVRAQG
ncbi:helix-turn-helix domain-containing protein [Thetidibacter halocola]|uniref:Helix-turn-helix domain-containing protein n=1 Tax=Thetidibacter halocola TaxID=2827239 RepID=A0A8J7WGB9_9RHOB|nr:helix-turn-helix domain-containing protein [Thetidibacter halocola]MBS0124811.1 helix-turn-helix domain-containing protein [Thetidibacter halocola]